MMNHPGPVRRVLLLLLLLAGCATVPQPAAPPTGQVGVSEVNSTVPGTARLVLERNETFFMPLPDSINVIPNYPGELLAQRLPPQALCLRVSIDASGDVMEAAPVSVPPDCPKVGGVAPAFFEAAQDAVRSWRFDPAFRCVFPQGATPDPNGACFGEGVREVPQAVSLAYRFVFEQIDGKGAVRLGQ